MCLLDLLAWKTRTCHVGVVMKVLSFFLAAALSLPAAATTVIVGGGADGRPFVNIAGPLVGPLHPSTSSIQVGVFANNIFTVFAPADASPATFFNVAADDPAAGNWTGITADTSAAATAFNGLQIWFRVTSGSAIAYLASGALFPANGAGIGDSITIDSRDLTIPPETSFSYIDEPNDRIVIFAPEPSTMLFGLLGGVALLRRRR
jgi:uncharacterized protein (TIGR03382 family)